MLTLARKLFFGVAFVCICLSIFLFWEQYRPNKYKLENFEHSPKSVSVFPSHLSYKDHALPISTSSIKDGRWPLSSDSIIYLEDSGAIGHSGNAIIYGHNWPNLLGFLKEVKPGETVRLTTSDNKYFDYTVELVAEITPDQTHILSQSDDTRLTMYTCSGFLDRKRLVVVAKMSR